MCINDDDDLKSAKRKLDNKFEVEVQGEVHYLLGMAINRNRKSKRLTIDQNTKSQKCTDSFFSTPPRSNISKN